MYVIIKDHKPQDILTLCEEVVRECKNVIRKSGNNYGVNEHLNKAKNTGAEVLKHGKPLSNVLEVFSPTFHTYISESAKKPFKNYFNTKEEVNNFLSQKEGIKSNSGTNLYVGRKVVCSFVAKYGGTKTRKIRKITSSGIYFEGLSVPIPIKDTHRIL